MKYNEKELNKFRLIETALKDERENISYSASSLACQLVEEGSEYLKDHYSEKLKISFLKMKGLGLLRDLEEKKASERDAKEEENKEV